jgi:cobalt-precorrin 5A hydrolase
VAPFNADYAVDGGEVMSERHSIGIGCSTQATAEDVLQLIERCVNGITPDTTIATLDRCSVVAEAVASSLGLKVVLFPASVLVQVPGVESRSGFVAAKVGTSSVAEASALASLGPEARLILRRQVGRLCTCAMAVLP